MKVSISASVDLVSICNIMKVDEEFGPAAL